MKHSFFIVLLTALVLTACNSSSSLEALSFEEKLKSTDKAVLLDIRTNQEYVNQHIPGAVNLNINDADFESQLATIDKEASIFFYCTSGSRSKKAAKIIAEQGFANSYELEQGLQAWTASGLEVKKAEPKAKAITFTSAQYDEIMDSNELVLVDFMADWCGPCKAMAPTIEKLKKELDGQLKVVKINTDFNQELSVRFQITSIPTLKIYHKGELVFDQAGYLDETQLRAALAAYM